MYNDKITIIKTPNKGESGLREAFKNICSVAKRLVDSNEIEQIQKKQACSYLQAYFPYLKQEGDRILFFCEFELAMEQGK